MAAKSRVANGVGELLDPEFDELTEREIDDLLFYARLEYLEAWLESQRIPREKLN